jgi:hypothetical protein
VIVDVQRPSSPTISGAVQFNRRTAHRRESVLFGCAGSRHASVTADPATIEATTDALGSRTVRVGLTNRRCAVSTRIVNVVGSLGSYVPNLRAFGSFLLRGTLPLGESWDARVIAVPANTRWSFDVERWAPATGIAAPAPTVEAQLDALSFLEVPREEISEVRPGPGWVVPLSGGYDSRALLLFGGFARTYTHGSPGAESDRRGDAAIAARLAAWASAEHDFIAVDHQTIAPDAALVQCVDAGEGRTDSLGGYVDGMRIWALLAKSGVTGMVRGDEAFGWIARRDEDSVRASLGLTTPDDFIGLATCARGDRGSVRRGRNPRIASQT